jgi:predicted DsbA family dithiol-disulfide isomerase
MEYNQAVFRAFFEDGEDIEKVEVLTRLASRVGLDGESLLEALEKKAYLPAVLADESEAEELGIHGVPAFIADRKAALSGVQPVESLRRLIEQARSLR